MDNITTESQLFLLHMNLVHLSRLFSEKSLNLSDTEDFDSETHECVPTDLFQAERSTLAQNHNHFIFQIQLATIKNIGGRLNLFCLKCICIKASISCISYIYLNYNQIIVFLLID